MSRPETRAVSFQPQAACVPEVRRFVVALLRDWGVGGEAVGDSALCAVELATNAVLHTREPFIVTVRTAGAGIRIEVLDGCPDQLPVAVPSVGSATDLTIGGTTGRGLQIVAALATRWGITTSDGAKTVWVEIGRLPSAGPPTKPIITLEHRHETPRHDVARLELLHMPVRTAVASGVLLEEAVRELQLMPPGRQQLDPAVRGGLFALLGASASPRLAGRHAALRAAADGRTYFDLALTAGLDALKATAEVGPLLADLSGRLGPPVDEMFHRVLAFRAWIVEESRRQLSGGAPSPCTLKP